MARKIIVLDAVQDSDGVNLIVNFVCWLVAPPSRIFPSPNFTSRVPLVAAISWGVTAAELSALQGGSIIEQSATIQESVAQLAAQATDALRNAILQSLATARYNALQTVLTNKVYVSATHFPGASWDGTTWTGGP